MNFKDYLIPLRVLLRRTGRFGLIPRPLGRKKGPGLALGLNSIYLTTLLFLVACDKTIDEPISADEHWILGKWKQTEAYISAGGPQYWVNVENGEEIEFFENGTFSSDRFTDCISGKFSIEENKLLLEYNCIGFNPESENEEGFITYEMEFFPDHFILTPTSGPICIEGCSFKYQNKK